MLRAGLAVKAFAHITSDGLLNLIRVQADVGYILTGIPEPHPIFQLIQRHGDVAVEEMFRVYNMGIGFCVIVSPEDAAAVQAIAKKHGVDSTIIGFAVNDPARRVRIPPHKLIGEDGKFSIA
jgi:phosphoribosylformylglycinamidine cyclo-ligase